MNKNDEKAAKLAYELDAFIGVNPTRLKKVNAYLRSKNAAFRLEPNDTVIG